jgi:hypothetical protein
MKFVVTDTTAKKCIFFDSTEVIDGVLSPSDERLTEGNNIRLSEPTRQ